MNPQEKAKLNEFLSRLKQIHSAGLQVEGLIDEDRSKNLPTIRKVHEGLLRASHRGLESVINDFVKLLKKS